MKFSLNIAGREFNLGMKSADSPAVAAFKTGTDIDDAARGAQLINPYAQSAWVFMAVSVLAQTVAQIPFRVSRISGGNARTVRALRGASEPRQRQRIRKALGEDILDSGDVVDLFNRPHPTMDAHLFMEMLVTWFALRGEMFLVPLDEADAPVDLGVSRPRVRRMLPLDPAMFWHMVQGYDLMAWRYTGSPLMSPIASEVLSPSEVIHVRQPNPYLYWRGMSPLTVAGLAAQTDFAGEQFQKGLWVNNADTGIIITTEQQATPEQQAAILAALRERKRKAGTADRPLFLWGGAKMEKPTLSMMDMQFLETRKFLRQEIFGIFKVPETLAGFTADLNDGGAGGSLDASKASFVESTIGSLCARLEKALNQIVSTFGDDLVGWFDIDSLPIMQAARRARWDVAGKMFNLGVPLNDISENLDLGLPEYGWGNKSFLPFSLQEVSATGLGDGEPLPSETEPADDAMAEKSNPFARMLKLLSAAPVQKTNTAALWRKRMNFRKQHVNLFAGKVGKVLMKYRGLALAKLDEVHLQKDFSELSKKGLVDILFSHVAFGKSLNEELKQPTAAVLQAAAENMRAEIGQNDPWKYPSKKVLEYIAKREVKINGVAENVRNILNTTLQQGIENGEMHDELAARVRSKFTELTDGQARVIARTEVNSAASEAGLFAMADAGIGYKSWLGSHGPHAREGHQSVEDATINEPIPVTECFEVPDEHGNVDLMLQPLDETHGAGPGNIINCQCDVLAAEKTGEDEKSRTFKIFGVGVMSFPKNSPGGQAR